jgi:hypothetical protein
MCCFKVCCVVLVTPGFVAILTGTAIEKLCEAALEDSLTDRGAVVRAARCLLGSVTRVLLLADVVVVKQLLLAKDKVRIAVNNHFPGDPHRIHKGFE